VASYRTEIVIPADRYICIQLPPDFPEGIALVGFRTPDDDAPGDPTGHREDDGRDIEWWEPGAVDDGMTEIGR